MIPYNTDFERIRLPEFGRTVQSLVDYCVQLQDRAERNDCAYAIADVMLNMFPELKGENGDMSQVWDQMQIMSGFKLDVDFPCEVITEETLNPKPKPIPYTSSHIALRHYGKTIEKMIPVIADMEDGQERDELINMIANHMKKVLTISNKDVADDARILRDLEIFSGGKIKLDPSTYHLHEFLEAPSAQTGKKKRKK